MKSPKFIALAVVILFAALWSVPVFRAVSLLRDTQASFAETGSINASNDLSFSSTLLLCYFVSLAAAFTVAWLYSRSGSWLFIIPVGILGYSVIEVLRVQPEEVIVLFPVMAPGRPAAISLIAVALALALFYAHRRYGHIQNAEPDAPPNSRPPSQLPTSPKAQTPDSLRTPSSGGCG